MAEEWCDRMHILDKRKTPWEQLSQSREKRIKNVVSNEECPLVFQREYRVTRLFFIIILYRFW